mgnify:CR=1 FL=1
MSGKSDSGIMVESGAFSSTASALIFSLGFVDVGRLSRWMVKPFQLIFDESVFGGAGTCSC